MEGKTIRTGSTISAADAIQQKTFSRHSYDADSHSKNGVTESPETEIKEIHTHSFQPVTSWAIVALIILFLNNIASQWLIFLFVYLKDNTVDPRTNIQVDLKLDDTEFGIVTGTAFTFVNAAFGLLMGYLADRYSRKWLLFICALCWNVATAVSYFCHTFLQIVFPRMVFAAFQAACIPACASLINTYYGETRALGRANSIFSFGVYLGVGLSSLTLIMNTNFGWRTSLLIVCGVSFFFGLLILLLQDKKHAIKERHQIEDMMSAHDISYEPLDPSMLDEDKSHLQSDPERPKGSKSDSGALGTKLRMIFSEKSYVLILIASSLRFMGGYSIAFWGASFFTEVYPDQLDQYSWMNAIVTIGGGMPSAYLGGLIGDYYESEKGGLKYKAKAYLSGFGALASCVFVALCYLAQVNFWVSIGSLYMAYLFAEVWLGITYSMINKIMPSHAQGVAISIFHLSGALAGALATFILGVLGDALEAKTHPHRYGYIMGIAVLISYVSCCPVFMLAGRAYEQKMHSLKSAQLRMRPNQQASL